MKLRPLGAAGGVTGSMHLLEIGDKKILLDCGLFQGRRQESEERNRKMMIDPATIDALVLSHAHMDHCGRIPILVRDGFKGPIYCTAATRDLVAFLLVDSGHIQEEDARHLAKRGIVVKPLYTIDDAKQVPGRMTPIAYSTPFDVLPGISARFEEAGHILGSTNIQLTFTENGKERRLSFSGDVGRKSQPIIRDPAAPPGGADVLIIESTYGGKKHEPQPHALDHLARVIKETAAKGGKIIVPAFALERTQELLLMIQQLIEANAIPVIPIYVDSPLAVNITEVFRAHTECFDDAEAQLKNIKTVFDGENIHYTHSVEESKALNGRPGPMIILSASGMAEAGRILHHLANNIGDPRNTVLFVGYQAEHTLGRRIIEGAPEIKVFGELFQVKAKIESIEGFSGHADEDELIAWYSMLNPKPKQIVLVHGENPQREALKARFAKEAPGIPVAMPEYGDAAFDV